MRHQVRACDYIWWQSGAPHIDVVFILIKFTAWKRSTGFNVIKYNLDSQSETIFTKFYNFAQLQIGARTEFRAFFL